MSDLIVLGYDTHEQAERAYDQILQLDKDFVVRLEGLALVDVDAEGKTHVETPSKVVGASATGGALWGTLIGLLFFVPLLGAAIGGAMGALFGKMGKSGIDETFRSQVRDLLRPGSSGVVMMASKLTEDKFADAMGPYGGTVLKTSLSEQDEQELVTELRAGEGGASAPGMPPTAPAEPVAPMGAPGEPVAPMGGPAEPGMPPTGPGMPGTTPGVPPGGERPQGGVPPL